MPKLETLEVSLLLQVLKDKYQADFQNYRSSYLLRRIHRRMELDQHETITLMTNEIIHHPQYAQKFIQDMSINVTDMFRFPSFFQALITDVFPNLRTYPSIRIWIAGCATGEEVLSLTILLKEAGLLHHCSILATDINQKALHIAQQAMYPIENIKQWTLNYTLAGGKESFPDYYSVKYNQAIFDSSLLEQVRFEKHDLTTSDYPTGFRLVLCRNVLIYFNNVLQEHVIQSFTTSLYPNGFLGLGDKENLPRKTNQFSVVNRLNKVYQRL